jgi:hypothetical protein
VVAHIGDACLNAAGDFLVDLLQERGDDRVAVFRSQFVVDLRSDADVVGVIGETATRAAEVESARFSEFFIFHRPVLEWTETTLRVTGTCSLVPVHISSMASASGSSRGRNRRFSSS